MSIESLLYVLIVLVCLGAVAWLAKWIIDGFFPEPIRTPATVVVGVILLILVIYLMLNLIQGGPAFRLRN